MTEFRVRCVETIISLIQIISFQLIVSKRFINGSIITGNSNVLTVYSVNDMLGFVWCVGRNAKQILLRRDH